MLFFQDLSQLVISPRHYTLTKWPVNWDAFKMKNANLTTANPMLMKQRRNVNWVTELKNQVQKTWGVTHVLLIMEEVPLTKVLNLSHIFITWAEKRGREKSEHFGCHNKSSWSIFFSPPFKLCQRRLISFLFPLKTRIGQLNGPLTCHACRRGQNASCARAVVSHFAE